MQVCSHSTIHGLVCWEQQHSTVLQYSVERVSSAQGAWLPSSTEQCSHSEASAVCVLRLSHSLVNRLWLWFSRESVERSCIEVTLPAINLFSPSDRGSGAVALKLPFTMTIPMSDRPILPSRAKHLLWPRAHHTHTGAHHTVVHRLLCQSCLGRLWSAHRQSEARELCAQRRSAANSGTAWCSRRLTGS